MTWSEVSDSLAGGLITHEIRLHSHHQVSRLTNDTWRGSKVNAEKAGRKCTRATLAIRELPPARNRDGNSLIKFGIIYIIICGRVSILHQPPHALASQPAMVAMTLRLGYSGYSAISGGYRHIKQRMEMRKMQAEV